jgi:molybdenum cofactor cytidylyltransferase
MTAAVVLAAGGSTRLGEPKQLVVIGGETLLERAVRTARAAGCVPVLVVLGAAAEEVRARCDLGDAVVIVNPDWEEGMASSIGVGLRAARVGVGAVKDIEGVVLMTCDQPAVTAEHLRALMAAGEVTASAYAGRRGVPAYFTASSFAALLQLKGDAGARELLRGVRAIELANGELDVDTTADVDAAKRLCGTRPKEFPATQFDTYDSK